MAKMAKILLACQKSGKNTYFCQIFLPFLSFSHKVI